MYFHRTVRDRATTGWRRCSVAIDVVVDRWRCRPDVEGGPLIRSILEEKKDNIHFFFLQNFSRKIC